MSKKIFYIYNPKTLTYERVYPSLRQRIIVVLRHLFVGSILSIGVIVAFYFWFGSPKEELLKMENEQMQTQYKVLSKRVDAALEVLNDLQQRDDNMYRVILQAEPVNDEIRNNGIYNPSRYENLLQMSDAELVVSTSQKVDNLARQVYVQCNSMNELVKLAQGQEERIKHIPAIQPVSNKDLKRTASGYGYRIDPIYKTTKFHQGMDFTAPVGTDIYATGNGTVVSSGWKQGYGNCVEINHGFGYLTLYGHMSKIKARIGQKVKRGDVIGLVGSTGKSTGPHLHYEVHLRGEIMNPQNYYFLDLSPAEYDKMVQMSNNSGQMFD
jgi:murein DD-endopeptidase MepM/ murein hydrolase activator NlpD